MCVFRDGGDEAAVRERGEEHSGEGGEYGVVFEFGSGLTAEMVVLRCPLKEMAYACGVISCIAPTLQILFFFCDKNKCAPNKSHKCLYINKL